MLGCVKLRDRFHLALETLHERFVLGETPRQHFDRHNPLHAAMPRLEDRAHAAGPQVVEHVVISDPQLGLFLLIDGLRLVLRQKSRSDQ